MWRFNNLATEKEMLITGFPSSLRREVEEVLDILPFNYDIILTDGQVHKVDCLIHDTYQEVWLDQEALKIPYRLYFNEPEAYKEINLTELQKAILNCIYLRHHNGFVRQKRLEELIGTTPHFVIPYTFQLLGEYVMEILEVLDGHISANTISSYIKFIRENQRYWQQTESRMISYWNIYYRGGKFAKLNDYIGKQIVDKLKANAQYAAL